MKEMIRDKKKLVGETAKIFGGNLPENHPVLKALKALEEAADELNI